MSTEYQTAQELAVAMRLKPRTLLALARRGIVPSLKIGSSVRFSPTAVAAALARPAKPAKPAAGASPLPSGDRR